MTDEFDHFLASSLAPGDRLPDRRFVAAVQARIMVEDCLARERRALVGSLVGQLLAVMAVAAGLWVIGKAAPVQELFVRSPALVLATVLVAFGLAVALFSRTSRHGLLQAEP